MRRARWLLIVATALAPLVGFGALGALRSTSNDPRQWLPSSFEETDYYDWFQSHFGNDEVAVVSWPGCTLDDPRVPQLAAALESSPYFDSVLSGPQVLGDLTSPPLELSRAGAISRLRGILIDPQGDTTCLLLKTSAAGSDDRVAAVAAVEQLALEHCRLPAEQLRLVGPTVDAAAIDIESRRLLFQLAGVSALISFCIATMRLRSVRLAVIILAVATYSTGVSLAIVYFSGCRMNLLMTMLPPLVYVLSISSAVHLANYYRDAAVHQSPFDAIRTCVAHGMLPCVLAAVTTGIGLASLTSSSIDPIIEFGIFSATGVVSSVLILFLLLPSALRLFPPNSDTIVRHQRQSSGLSDQIVATIERYHLPLTVGCLALMVFCASRLPHVKSTVRLQDRFLPSSDTMMDYRWMERNIGPMVPLEVVLRFDADDPRDTVEQLRLVAAAQARIRSLDQPVATMSAINLTPPLPSGRTVRHVIARERLNSQRTTERLIDARMLAVVDGQRLWRITVRARAVGDMDYGYFSETIRHRVDPLLSEHGIHGTYTGVIPLIYKAQRQLLEDLFRSFLAAFVVIAIVLVVVLRSVTAALLAMIPNLFPAVVVFGSVECLDIPVQIGSVMTASAALGIAVDDTVHFLTWFRRGLAQGLHRAEALRQAYSRCSGAMAHTTLICSSGLLVFAFSTFVPILHFAWLMVFLLVAALVGDLVLLPSILAGGLGRSFEKRRAAVLAKS